MASTATTKARRGFVSSAPRRYVASMDDVEHFLIYIKRWCKGDD